VVSAGVVAAVGVGLGALAGVATASLGAAGVGVATGGGTGVAPSGSARRVPARALTPSSRAVACACGAGRRAAPLPSSRSHAPRTNRRPLRQRNHHTTHRDVQQQQRQRQPQETAPQIAHRLPPPRNRAERLRRRRVDLAACEFCKARQQRLVRPREAVLTGVRYREARCVDARLAVGVFLDDAQRVVADAARREPPDIAPWRLLRQRNRQPFAVGQADAHLRLQEVDGFALRGERLHLHNRLAALQAHDGLVALLAALAQNPTRELRPQWRELAPADPALRPFRLGVSGECQRLPQAVLPHRQQWVVLVGAQQRARQRTVRGQVIRQQGRRAAPVDTLQQLVARADLGHERALLNRRTGHQRHIGSEQAGQVARPLRQIKVAPRHTRQLLQELYILAAPQRHHRHRDAHRAHALRNLETALLLVAVVAVGKQDDMARRRLDGRQRTLCEQQRRAHINPAALRVHPRHLRNHRLAVGGFLNRRKPVHPRAADNHAELVLRAQQFQRLNRRARRQLNLGDAVLLHRHTARNVHDNHHRRGREDLALAHIQVHRQHLGDGRLVVAARQERVLAANHREADARVAHRAL
jgi:hypothetical protein